MPVASAIATGSMSSTAPPTIETRAGGRWTAPVDRSRDPTKPNFQSSRPPGRRRGHALGLGAAWWLGGELAPPGQELAVGRCGTARDLVVDGRVPACAASASVVRSTSTSAPSARWTSATTSPGAARSSIAASTSPGWAAPVCPTVEDRSSASASGAVPSLPARALAARPCMRGHRDVADVVGRRRPPPSGPGRTPRARGGRSGSRRNAPPTPWNVGRPGARHRSTNSSVADAPPRYSAITGAPGPSSPTSKAAAPSPPADSSAAAGQAVALVGQHDERGPRAAAAPARAAARAPMPERSAPPKSRAATSRGEPKGGVHRGRVGLVQVGRGGGGEPERRRGGRRGRAQGQAGRLDPHGGGVLVVRGDRPGALAPAGAQERGDLRPLEAPVGDIARGAQDPSHGQ